MFTYNNIHNYELKKNPNPFLLSQEKGTQQVRYELLQEKLKQNQVIHQYKKYSMKNKNQTIENSPKRTKEFQDFYKELNIPIVTPKIIR